MADFTGKLALVVDDEPDAVAFMSRILENNGFKTYSANNGNEAFERVKEQKPDIVFLDLMMPEESGMQFIHNIKKSENYKNIPIIIVSGASEETGVDMKELLFDDAVIEMKKEELGIDTKPDGLVEKPVNPEELIAIIEKVLSS
ncbi:MAG: response regulator [Spirochaetota bacterium]|nr:MAG: response regulator [Spirochaetota bacterium]